MADTYAEISAAQSEINKLNESIRIAQGSLSNINPAYQSNAAYISKLKAQILTDQTAIGLLQSKITSLQQEDTPTTPAKVAASKTPTTPKTPDASDSDKQGDASYDTAESKRFSNYAPNSETGANTTDGAGSTPAGKAGADSNPSASDAGTGLPGRRLHNPLGDFSSYTYKISLYMISPDTYNTYIAGGKIIPTDFQLIAQSGGITNNVADPSGKTTNYNSRADGFDLDFYIDNLQMKSAISGKETLGPVNTHDFSFQIYEPYGFTLPTKLIQAATKMQKNSNLKRELNEPITALQCMYLLSVRFYGYDVNGALISGSNYPQADVSRSDSQAVFERSWPIGIYHFDFKLDNKVTTYNIKAKAIGDQLGMGVMRGILQTQAKLTGETVRDILVGSSASNKGATTISGLIQQLNDEQRKFTKEVMGDQYTVEIPDEYDIKFQPNSGLDTATIVDKDYYDKDRTPMPIGIPEKLAGLPAIVPKQREVILAKGTPIIKAIDQILSQSSYVKDAFTYTDNDEVAPVNENEKTFEVNKPKKALTWWNVTPVVDKLLGFDKKRKIQACKITYMIQQYEIPYVRSMSHGYTSKYYGPHKRYEYWYTGKNTEIISYDQQYNLLYFNNALATSQAGNANKNDSAPNAPTSATGADGTGEIPGGAERVNGVRTFLYSPADQIKVKMVIQGDPDYLMTATTSSLNDVFSKWYGPDFTINPSSGQVFVEVNFKQAEDYKASIGLLTGGGTSDTGPNGEIHFWDYPEDLKKKIKGVAYYVWSITSTFNKGMFTQELKVAIPPFSALSDTAKPPAEEQRKIETPTNSASAAQKVDKSPLDSNGVNSWDNADQKQRAPATGSADDDKQIQDPMGTGDAAAIMAAAQGREESSPSSNSFLGRIFGAGQNAGRGRGSQGR
jgi:hypothetical protein